MSQVLKELRSNQTVKTKSYVKKKKKGKNSYLVLPFDLFIQNRPLNASTFK